MRKLIWCAAAGAVAAGSAWATVYAWNHDALGRGCVTSTCMVSLVDKVHERTPKHKCADTPSHDTVSLWRDPATTPNAEAEHRLKLDMPIVIHEEPTPEAGQVIPAVPTAEEVVKAVQNMNKEYDCERDDILEQLRPLLSEITTAEIMSKKAVEDDGRCLEPMGYCDDGEVDAPRAAPVHRMPYADEEEPAAKATPNARFDVSELIWAVPFLGVADTNADELMKLVVELNPDLAAGVGRLVGSHHAKPEMDEVEPMSDVNEATELLTGAVSGGGFWLHVLDTIEKAAESLEGTEESEPSVTEPEPDLSHYHQNDLSCPYSGCPYPGNYQRMPSPPSEEPATKPAGEDSKKAEKDGEVGGWNIHVTTTVLAQLSPPTTAPQYGFGSAQGYAPPDEPMPLPTDAKRFDGFGASITISWGSAAQDATAEVVATAGAAAMETTTDGKSDWIPLPDGGAIFRSDATLSQAPPAFEAIFNTLDSEAHLQKRIRATKAEASMLSQAKSVAVSFVHDVSEMSLTSAYHRAKEMLADYVHMINYDRDAYSEDPVVTPREVPETFLPKVKSDTLEFRSSDLGPNDNLDDSGPF